MTIDEARGKIVQSIDKIYGEDEAKNIAELLLEHITNLPLIERIIKKNEHLPAKQEELLNESIRRLEDHEPVQYIIKESWFAGIRFYVDRNVLIPRPETEELVEWAAKEVGGRNFAVRILDVGTGSGCIAIALKTKLPDAGIWACDISDEALNVARMNAYALQATINFVPLNFLDPGQRKQLPHVDVIVSNPPYIPLQDKNEMKKNVIEYEPSVALFVSNRDPLIFYKAIADFGKEKLNNGGSIYVEVHEDLGEKVRNLFQAKGYNSVKLKKDLQGKDRMIRAG